MGFSTLRRKIRQKRKSFVFGFFHLFFDKPPGNSSIIPDNPQKLLFLRFDNKIGDMVVSSFVFREVKRSRPDTFIGVVAGPANACILKLNPYVDRIYICRNHRRIQAVWRTAAAVRKDAYDVLFDMTTEVSKYQILFLHLAKCGTNIGYLKSGFPIYDTNIGQKSKNRHMVHRHTESLEHIGIPVNDTSYDLHLCSDAEDRVNGFLNRIPSPHKITVNLFGKSRHRQFTMDRAEEIIRAIRKQFPESAIILLVAKGKGGYIRKLISKLADPQIVGFFDERTGGQRDLDDVICLLKDSDLIMTPDTAIVHLAVAVNAKVVAIYNDEAGVIAEWHPNSPRARYMFSRKPVDKYDKVNVGDFKTGELIAMMKGLDARPS